MGPVHRCESIEHRQAGGADGHEIETHALFGVPSSEPRLHAQPCLLSWSCDCSSLFLEKQCGATATALVGGVRLKYDATRRVAKSQGRYIGPFRGSSA